MPGKAARSQPVTLTLPPEPPELTPGLARVLLRNLVKAYEKQLAEEGEADAAPGPGTSRGLTTGRPAPLRGQQAGALLAPGVPSTQGSPWKGSVPASCG
jgi:hypothetical protein